ncbi:probable LRR receptor-like serine/threonine-protein kinase At3g47570 [Pyrus x bretschneideri]|uniref:probable LRR receptor-like serine/threonine-protein kinase At3g47570 n=1 Tax=Pyrus x bretschneideri TaxID=225117 RepID=UPI0020301EED|nr:probable LRR receptor-like serine/threonine-protein kinase At3g47570 [Pyrus x bretschneideri]
MHAYKLGYSQDARQPQLTQTKVSHETDTMGLYKFTSSLLFFSYLCMHAFVLNSCLSLALAGSNETDKLALLEFKARITTDPFGVMSSWNETIHFCQWHGVTCGHRHKRITMLILRSLKLGGSIPPHVGNLSFLRVFNLENNNFSHGLPPEIGRLRRLQLLGLRNNSLSGEIPANLSGCSKLNYIHIGSNLLEGSIPKELGTLSKLIKFKIEYNHHSGSIPYSFSNISSLEAFGAAFNSLSGSIPDIFGRLTNFYFLGLDENDLSGTIPPSIFNVSSLETFAVGSNNLQGTFPSNLGNSCPRLQFFAIEDNQFSGTIHVSISNASNLITLQIGENQLHGEVPSLKNLHKLGRFISNLNDLGSGGTGDDLTFLCDLTNATGLQYLQIDSNNFGGMLPQCLANLSSSLLFFTADDNSMFGTIPNAMENLHNLEAISLSDNQFSGLIPPAIGRLSKLYEVFMRNNLLSGNVPSSFGNLSQLTHLHLDHNNLQGTIPSTLAECPHLMNLTLGGNNFTGIISSELIRSSSSYVHLDLSRNHLTGFLPTEVGQLINLEHFDVSRNLLSGEIPPSLGSCKTIQYLDLQENFFQGTIPSGLSSLRGIETLSLARNNLSGTIPKFLENFTFLQSLNLSYNNLEGAVPIEGVFRNANATSVQGNTKLCGGIPEFQLPKCEFRHSSKRGLSLTLKLVISLLCGLSGALFSFAILYLCCFRGKKKEDPSSDSEKFPKVSYQSLLKATDGFSSANLIGMGSFGSVYKGLLDQGETTIAIKVLNLARHGASKSFIAECDALKNIRHRNLVKVLSACSGFDYRGSDFKALIYEFMVNGSLEEWLHPAQTSIDTNQRPRSLTFSQRLNIAIDVAMALDYLHHQCHVPIVHCDLKPSNVLLDDDMIGHVGDFGLARFLPRTLEDGFGNQSSSIGVKGTIGYTPPEYGMGHEVWPQGDVYSYGILLLVMFTGKRPTGDMFQGSSNLHNFVKAALPEQVLDIVDPVLIQEKGEGEMSANQRLTEASTRIRMKFEESLISILGVGVACSADMPGERSDITDAMAEMCRIRNKLRADKMLD